MTAHHHNILWYDRVQQVLETAHAAAMQTGDISRARRALMLRLWANDRAELLAEGRRT